MLMDKLPLPSKLPAQLVCHWPKGKATLTVCNNVHEPPGVPFVTKRDSPVPLKLICVMCDVDAMFNGGTFEATVTGPKKKSASPP